MTGMHPDMTTAAGLRSKKSASKSGRQSATPDNGTWCGHWLPGER